MQGIMRYASRPLADFNKYEALEMLESLQHTAQDTKHEHWNFYRLVYQTVRWKMDVPYDQLKSLILRVLGDKDHEKDHGFRAGWYSCAPPQRICTRACRTGNCDLQLLSVIWRVSRTVEGLPSNTRPKGQTGHR